MIHLIVGHRGTGKTSWLWTLKEELEQGRYIDLDTYIEKEEKTSVSKIFEKKGQKIFRQLEVSYLNKLVSKYHDSATDTFIAVGAGFTGYPPEGVHTIWLRRPTDENGRVFIDRPRLSHMQSSLDEYHSLFDDRQKRYSEWADEVFEKREGQGEAFCLGEKIFWGLEEKPNVGGVLTLMPEFLRSEARASRFLEKRLGWEDVQFELRDDLLSGEQMQWACGVIPYERRIASLRKSNQINLVRSMAGTWDWALELGMPPEGEDPSIISQHERGEQRLDLVLDQFTEIGKKWRFGILKFAVEIKNFEELEEGHQWWKIDPHRRCFLPRSTDGRWRWYRQLMGRKMDLGFWREGQGSAIDQPSLSEWLAVPKGWTKFAAVLGDPVSQSWTPVEQESFFASRNMPVVPIQISEDELTAEVLEFLRELGLAAAAVTSPLKTKIRSLVYDRAKNAEELGAANTLVLQKDNKWLVDNTDIDGLKALLAVIPKGAAVAVWGGGGTRGILQELLPMAQFFSARRGELLDGVADTDFEPQVVVWAVGRARHTTCKWPSEAWQPELVVDLNYTEDSPGLEYAEKCGAQYESGSQMFKVQAESQRKIWQEIAL